MRGVKTCWPGFTERGDNTRLLPAQRDKSPALSGSSCGVQVMAVNPMIGGEKKKEKSVWQPFNAIEGILHAQKQPVLL